MLALLWFRKTDRIEAVCCFWLTSILAFRGLNAWISIPRIAATPLILD